MQHTNIVENNMIKLNCRAKKLHPFVTAITMSNSDDFWILKIFARRHMIKFATKTCTSCHNSLTWFRSTSVAIYDKKSCSITSSENLKNREWYRVKKQNELRDPENSNVQCSLSHTHTMCIIRRTCHLTIVWSTTPFCWMPHDDSSTEAPSPRRLQQLTALK